MTVRDSTTRATANIGVTTLSAGPPTIAGSLGQFVTDQAGGTVWVCITAGAAGVAVWNDVSKVEVADVSDGTATVSYTDAVTATLITGMTRTGFLLARPHHITHRYLMRHSVAVGGFWIQTWLDDVAVDATFHIGSGGTANTAGTYTTTHRILPATAASHKVEAKVLLVTAGTVQSNPGGGQPCHMYIDRA